MKDNKDFILGAVNTLPLESTAGGFKVLLLDWAPNDIDKDGKKYCENNLLLALRKHANRRGPFYVEMPPFTTPDIKEPNRFEGQFIGATVRLHEIEHTPEGRIRVHGRLHITGPMADVLRSMKSGSFILTPWLIGSAQVFKDFLLFQPTEVVTFRFHFHGECEQATNIYSDKGRAYWELPPECWKVWEENGVVVQRTIVAAAFRATMKDGTKLTVPCARHGTPDAHALFNALRKGELLENDHAIGEDQGFIDQFGDYHNREQAYLIAKIAGQLEGREKTGSREASLYSEDLY
jgi:hypothetical protein